ncbi:glucosamine-6-phosphate deaminase [Parapedobacter koreensis]|uniref:Glucosamine-6-phosphate deaminase n=1 Tax=Parapedobacter koreensis TaxID=332977 RepID=A0A1H7S4L6_9SPHI|nr:glucosamine-6-phosphate deaminase [Parapedobacter koreensis]SEL67435.1 glucosamine-6-phosphate deaminase [Parapedobacter koreensis]
MTINKIDSLTIARFDDRPSLGRAAAAAVAANMHELLDQRRESVNVVFAAAPSQNEFLAALVLDKRVDWSRVNAFHMDEYIGLPIAASQRFGNFLKERLFAKLPFRSVNYLDGNATDPQRECQRYTDLLKQYPTDIACMGIGENGHIAFNDPHIADFNDPAWVKIVDLDLACRQQQVNDGCFKALEEVPTYALTLTVPALMAAQYVYCMVPGINKAPAVYHTLNEEITAAHPATVLREHPRAVLFLDADSASAL